MHLRAMVTAGTHSPMTCTTHDIAVSAHSTIRGPHLGGARAKGRPLLRVALPTRGSHRPPGPNPPATVDEAHGDATAMGMIMPRSLTQVFSQPTSHGCRELPLSVFQVGSLWFYHEQLLVLEIGSNARLVAIRNNYKHLTLRK